MAFTKRTPADKRFWAKVNKDGPQVDGARELGNCWEWTAARQQWGYGKFSIDGARWVNAHRFSYELANGPIPDGALVLHRCDNPPCVRPSHLRVGTAKENTRDMFDRGRAARIGAKGESNSHAKLTDDQILEARRRCAQGERIKDLAATFGVHDTTMGLIVRGQLWKHLGGPIKKSRQARKTNLKEP